MENRSEKHEHKIEPEPETEFEEEEVLDQELEEGQEKDWETGLWDDEDEESEVDEDTLMDLGYSVGKTLSTDKPVTLNTRSPTAKLTPLQKLNTSNVCHPLSP